MAVGNGNDAHIEFLQVFQAGFESISLMFRDSVTLSRTWPVILELFFTSIQQFFGYFVHPRMIL